MMRLPIICLTAVLLTLSGQGRANTLVDRWGVGFHQSLGGSSGVAAKYWFGPWGMLGTLGTGTFTPSKGGTSADLQLTMGLVRELLKVDHTHLEVGCLLDLGIHKPQIGNVATQVSIEVPLIVEHFFSEAFSVYGQVGLILTVVTDQGAALSPAEGRGAGGQKGFGWGLGNGTSAGAGFSFYF